MTTTMEVDSVVEGSVGVESGVEAIQRPTGADADALKQTFVASETLRAAAQKAVQKYREFLAPAQNLANHDQRAILLDAAIRANAAYLDSLDQTREVIQSIPAGTTAPGGANRQTAVFQLFGAVDPSLGRAMSAGDARKINSASFK